MKLSVALAVAATALLSGCLRASSVFTAGPGETSCEGAGALDRPLVVANYNIKSGLWTSLDDVADVLDGLDADVIALEEVDHGMARTGGIDQAAWLADRLGAERFFAGAMVRDGGAFGVALLSRVPVVRAERFQLPDAFNLEPRAGIDATVCAGDVPLRVIAAHSDVMPWAARAHVRAIADRLADTPAAPNNSTLVMGDLNTTPKTRAFSAMRERGLVDVLANLADKPTFQGVARLDYIFTNGDAVTADVIDSDASDHRPVRAQVRF